MELALNLAWLTLAVSMVWAWVKHAPRAGVDRRVQFVALALVILILLPAISVTDDLMAARNPAEIETCVRRHHDCLDLHAQVTATTALVVALFAGLPQEPAQSYASYPLPAPILHEPLLSSLETRPPPMA